MTRLAGLHHRVRASRICWELLLEVVVVDGTAPLEPVRCSRACGLCRGDAGFLEVQLGVAAAAMRCQVVASQVWYRAGVMCSVSRMSR